MSEELEAKQRLIDKCYNLQDSEIAILLALSQTHQNLTYGTILSSVVPRSVQDPSFFSKDSGKDTLTIKPDLTDSNKFMITNTQPGKLGRKDPVTVTTTYEVTIKVIKGDNLSNSTVSFENMKVTHCTVSEIFKKL